MISASARAGSSVDLASLDLNGLRLQWRNLFGRAAPTGLPRSLLYKMLVYRQQEEQIGGLSIETKRLLSRLADETHGAEAADASPSARVAKATESNRTYPPGTILVREWKGKLHRVTVMKEGFAWHGQTFASLSRISREITGINWNGHVFFGGKRKR